jgi:hypothetical protein
MFGQAASKVVLFRLRPDQFLGFSGVFLLVLPSSSDNRSFSGVDV